MTIKTFRGKLDDGAQDTLHLRTNDGKTGYRIVKFHLFPTGVGDITQESVVMIWKEKQTSVPTATATTNFADNSLLSAAAYVAGSGVGSYQTSPGYHFVVFDNEIFNQNIYVTHTDNSGANGINYYIELEQVKLNDNESTMATLQSIRSRYEAYTPAGPT